MDCVNWEDSGGHNQRRKQRKLLCLGRIENWTRLKREMVLVTWRNMDGVLHVFLCRWGETMGPLTGLLFTLQMIYEYGATVE
jgi:hypothetical protein